MQIIENVKKLGSRLKKVVVILSITGAGSGHWYAALALLEAFKKDGECEAHLIDVLALTPWWFRWAYNRPYIWMLNNCPYIWGWLYDLFDKPFGNRLSARIERWCCRRLWKQLDELQPDYCISTHFLPPDLIAWRRREGKCTFQHATHVTDVGFHGMWRHAPTEKYYLCSEDTKAYLQTLEIPSDRIEVTGIAVHPHFAVPMDKAKMRKQLSLHPNLFTVLVTTGGFAVGPLTDMVQGILQLSFPCQVVVLCGNDKQRKSSIVDIARAAGERGSPVQVIALDYIDNMHEYMAASDVLVQKCGGSTMSEALALGLPQININPVPGQEVRNAAYLMKHGAGIWCFELRMLPKYIADLYNSPQMLATMRENALRIGNPRAAFDIVESVKGQIGANVSDNSGTRTAA